MEHKILIAEDEERMRQLLVNYFNKGGLSVVEACNGQEAIDRFNSNDIALAIIDIMMPCLDGWTVCRSIRSSSGIPIVILTAKSEEEDELLGYELGADDYITKPFSPRVLVAKVKALLKRAEGFADKACEKYEFGGLTVNNLSHEVFVDGKNVLLSPKEYDLILYFVRNKGIALTRERILSGVWGYDYYGDTRTVDTHIKRLREKLQDKARLIATVRGSGYRFEVPE